MECIKARWVIASAAARLLDSELFRLLAFVIPSLDLLASMPSALEAE
jgi:hypothetical protein